MGGDRAVRQLQAQWRTDLEGCDSAGQIQRGTEPGGLQDRPATELPAGDAVGEAEIIADHRTRPGLATKGLSLDDQRRQPLRCPVHGGAQPGWPGPDDGQVKDSVGDVDDSSERCGDLPVRRVREHRLAHHLDNRVRETWSGRPRDRPADRRLRPIHACRHTETLQQVTNLATTATIRIDHHPHRLHHRCRRPRPISKAPGDRPVELLVAGARRLGQEGVDQTQRGSVPHGVHLIWSQPPFEQHDPFGRRRNRTNPAQHLDTVDGTRGQIGDHHRHRIPRRPQLTQPDERRIAVTHRLDSVVAFTATNSATIARWATPSETTTKITGSTDRF